jgi:predicted N-acetyltransferase YhbS
MSDHIHIRLYEPGDEEQIMALHSKVMNTPWSMDFWRWLYLDNPAGEAVTVVAEDRGRIVGHFAYFPFRMQWQGRPFMGSKSVQAMVDPDYQGRGLFTQITQRLLRQAQANSVPLTYSCPNEKSYYPLVHKVRYRNICEDGNADGSGRRAPSVPLLIRPLSPSALASAVVVNPTLQRLAVPVAKVASNILWPEPSSSNKSLDVAVEEISAIDDRFDSLWQLVAKDYSLCTIRDRRYLHWRYSQNPEREYLLLGASEGNNLRGYAVIGTDELMGLKAGFIVDILTRSQDHGACHALLSEALRRLQDNGMEVVASAMLHHHFYYRAFRRHGFFPVPQRWAPKKFFMVVHDNRQGIPSEVLHDHRQWFVTLGDWDVF